jgi:hypothetical protein
MNRAFQGMGGRMEGIFKNSLRGGGIIYKKNGKESIFIITLIFATDSSRGE